uniref:Uncharacterized protein n=1 Tax=Anguilla anguilla TaxID=7936 RepID=A0A0E9R7L3_ANGAN
MYVCVYVCIHTYPPTHPHTQQDRTGIKTGKIMKTRVFLDKGRCFLE